jgi:hypothetical protein
MTIINNDLFINNLTEKQIMRFRVISLKSKLLLLYNQ